MITVLIAERNLILRRGLQAALDAAPGFRIAAEASSLEQLLWCLTGIGHDVLLIEAGFLCQLGMKTLDEYTIGVSAPRIIVHSHVHDPTQGVTALQNGAHGYLTNRCSPLELRTAISQVANGKRYIDNALADELASYLAVSPNALPHLLLSPCELRIYKMLVLGLPLAGIAAQLNLGIQAVHAYKALILEKSASDGIAELVRQATARGRFAHADAFERACVADE